MSGIDRIPAPVRQAIMTALIRAGTKPPSENDERDESYELVLEAVSEGSTPDLLQALKDMHKDSRRLATLEEAQPLVDLTGPTRFKVGDRVKWNSSLYVSGMFPGLDAVGVITQVFQPALHDTTEGQSNAIAVRHDIAIAYIKKEKQDDGATRDELHEYTYDSRRFVLATE